MEQKKKRTLKKEIVKETRVLNVMFTVDGRGRGRGIMNPTKKVK